ncbi:MAG: hypothetical protein PHT00_02760 [Candidatus Methanomethylophilus sp.]|nr:hypothetical protein [Methanomethylophilus sp.]MDD4668439.1 hypothetical protein [Methanomethylophilus sp.]
MSEREAAYELYFCLYDLMCLYARQHEICYGQKLPGIDRSIAEIGAELQQLRTELTAGA